MLMSSLACRRNLEWRYFLLMNQNSTYLGLTAALVWRREGTALNQANVVGTPNHGGGHVMVWGALAANGVCSFCFIESIMNKMNYLDILKEHIPTNVEKLQLPTSFTFMHDNDLK